jgi:ferric-dicitrate binding protein FerR (iron transport regulator)
MSREERRAYKRMTKNQDPYALPSRASSGAVAARRRPRRREPSAPFTFVTGRFLAWAIGGAVVAALLGFSVAWPSMPLAVYAGLGAAVGWGLLVVGVRFLQRRMSTLQR